MAGKKESTCSKSTVATWEHRLGKPSKNLQDWICSYSGYREDVERPVRRLEAPKNRVILILGFGDQLQIRSVGAQLTPNQYQAFVVGLGEKPLITEHNGAQRCIEVELLPWAVDQLFGRPATEFTQGVVQLEDIWGNQADSLTEQLSELSSWPERFALVDRVLLEKMATSSQLIRPEIQWAWRQLEQHGGRIPIRQIAQMIGWSDRHFATCFRAQIGVTPKAAARRIRFNHANQLLKASEQYTLSAIAATCGYSDQSHFTREFRLFAGCSPTVYRKAHFADLLGTPGDIVDL